VRAFFLGCLVSVAPFALVILFAVGSELPYSDFLLYNEASEDEIANARYSYLLLYCYAVLGGLLSAAVYWWLRPRSDPRRRAAMRDAEESAGPSEA
jgi:hypothetical protein